MRLAYFGTSEFAVPALRTLAPNVVAVVTQPSRPSGRGNRMTATPVAQAALALDLPVQFPEKARAPEFIEYVRSLNLDALVVASYGQILSGALLDSATRGGINLHASLLPKYRGAAPIARAIQAGEATTGVTLMQMDKGMDTGDIVAAVKTPIRANETAGELEERLGGVAAELIREWMPRIVSGQYERIAQDDAAATYAPKLRKEDGRLQFEMTAEVAFRVYRAMTPKPGSFVETSLGPLKVIECNLSEGNGEPGTVLGRSAEGLEIAFLDRSLLLTTVQPENKSRVSGNAYANGRRLVEGDKL